jgi:hypothetical protein
VKASVKVKSVDHGYAALLKRLGPEFGRPQIAIGILEAEGAKAKEPWPEGEEIKEPVTVIDVAEANEFGTDTIPERSFIRAGFDLAEPKLRTDSVSLMKRVVKGSSTKEQVLDLLGLEAVGVIQQRIADGIEPENAKSTVDRKGSSKPLIASGQMRGTVTFAVREAGK